MTSLMWNSPSLCYCRSLFTHLSKCSPVPILNMPIWTGLLVWPVVKLVAASVTCSYWATAKQRLAAGLHRTPSCTPAAAQRAVHLFIQSSVKLDSVRLRTWNWKSRCRCCKLAHCCQSTVVMIHSVSYVDDFQLPVLQRGVACLFCSLFFYIEHITCEFHRFRHCTYLFPSQFPCQVWSHSGSSDMWATYRQFCGISRLMY